MERLLLLAAVVVIADTSIILSEFGVFSETPNEKKRKLKKQERENCSFKRNCSIPFAAPELPLSSNRVLEELLADRNRNYIGKITHLHAFYVYE
jgi:hypothetical protein